IGGAPPASNFLLAASSFNAPPNEQLELLALNAGVATAAGQFAESASFERGNALLLAASGPTLAVGLVRGTNDSAFVDAQANTTLFAGIVGGTNDALHLWQFVAAP